MIETRHKKNNAFSRIDSEWIAKESLTLAGSPSHLILESQGFQGISVEIYINKELKRVESLKSGKVLEVTDIYTNLTYQEHSPL
jgi:hypothetical protein